jgi:hypothetical protein
MSDACKKRPEKSTLDCCIYIDEDEMKFLVHRSAGDACLKKHYTIKVASI